MFAWRALNAPWSGTTNNVIERVSTHPARLVLQSIPTGTKHGFVPRSEALLFDGTDMATLSGKFASKNKPKQRD
jgi:hypothetical protein